MPDRESGEDSSGERDGLAVPSLKELVLAGLLEPGRHALRILYKGRAFLGDLDEAGTITDCTSYIKYNTPSGWSLACKRSVQPSVRADSGWTSAKVVPPASRHISAGSESTMSCVGLVSLSEYRTKLGPRGASGSLGLSRSRSLRWTCATCTFDNDESGTASACSKCQTPRSDGAHSRRSTLRSRAGIFRAASSSADPEREREG